MTDRPQDGPQRIRPDYRHAYPVFGLVVALLVTGAAARALARPPSFGQFGFYRGAAPAAARARLFRHRGKRACQQCHFREVDLHDKDAHGTIECEVCHGPGREHALRGTAESAALMRVPRRQADCLACHQQLDARPGWFPQIDVPTHYAFVGVSEMGTPCTACHDPHEPLYMDRDLRTARLHPVVHRCRDCHQGPTRDASAARPEGHPPIFDCSYCHQRVVGDFAKRPHSEVRCTTCHLFFRQSESAGRIIRDADPRFCLLCHREGEFRSEGAPPSVAWPQHLEEVREGPADALKRCVDCHQDQIHAVEPTESPEP